MGSSIAALGVPAYYRKMFVEAPWLACRLLPSLHRQPGHTPDES